jgi:hypothetical protein
MPLHVVPAEGLAGADSRLDVDGVAGSEAPEGRARESLRDGVHGHAAVTHVLRGQADAVDGDRVARG